LTGWPSVLSRHSVSIKPICILPHVWHTAWAALGGLLRPSRFARLRPILDRSKPVLRCCHLGVCPILPRTPLLFPRHSGRATGLMMDSFLGRVSGANPCRWCRPRSQRSPGVATALFLGALQWVMASGPLACWKSSVMRSIPSLNRLTVRYRLRPRILDLGLAVSQRFCSAAPRVDRSDVATFEECYT